MTFADHVARYTPTEGKALVEPWTSGGTVKGGLVFTHSRQLPIVYSFVWRLPPGYLGELFEGALVVHPRYAFETFVSGNELGVDGSPTPWSLAIMCIDDIEALIPLEEVLIA
jgi:hypothetical protein